MCSVAAAAYLDDCNVTLNTDSGVCVDEGVAVMRGGSVANNALDGVFVARGGQVNDAGVTCCDNGQGRDRGLPQWQWATDDDRNTGWRITTDGAQAAVAEDEGGRTSEALDELAGLQLDD